MEKEILKWYANGETGISSEAMAQAVVGNVPKRKGYSYPHDPADFNRCLKFLKAVPEAKKHLDKVAALGIVWNALIDKWAVIEGTFIDEVGFDWCKAKSAPKTYDLMKSIIDYAESA
jgi:hypothetical protein